MELTRSNPVLEKAVDVGVAAIPGITGLTIAAISRATGTPQLIAVPPLLDATLGSLPSRADHLKSYAKYTVGAAIVYADVLYYAVLNINL